MVFFAMPLSFTEAESTSAKDDLKQEGRQRSEEVAVVSPGGAVVRSVRGWQGLRGARPVQATHFRFRSRSGSRPGGGQAAGGRSAARRPAPNAARHEEAARLRWGRRPTAETAGGSPEAFPESLRVLRSETEGPRAPRQGNEGFSKNKSENTNPHHSRITFAVSFNIIL